uniref:Glycosyltransferase RgtA/B/C/D-like domain-containing protein n=1 Tax=Ignisphaera aggregans TaxID=334771 RepID=A0A7C2ZRT0_9CREN
MERPKLGAATIALLVFITVWAAYLYYEAARDLESRELSGFPRNKGYVSDEVWYVNSARNILRKIFGLTPRVDSPRATIILATFDDLVEAKAYASAYNIKILADETFFPNILKDEKKYAIYVESSSYENIEKFAKNFNAVDVVYGWILGDAKEVYSYMNLEHPPTAKYIIALTMFLMGDRPLFWRTPSIVMGITVVIMTFFLVYEITKRPDLGLVAATATAVDPMTRVMSSVAMLDIYVAAFSMIVLYLGVKGRLKEAAILTGLASTLKFSVLFSAIPLVFIYMNRRFKENRRALDVLGDSVLYVMVIALSFVFFQLLLSTPIILKRGISTWLDESLFGSIQWHLSIKCVGDCAPSSAPWEWFLGINSFPIYASPAIYAQGFVPGYITALVLMVFTLPAMTKESPVRTAWYLLTGVFLGYLTLWLLGGKTQYSFYAIHLTPLVYSYLVIQLLELLHREKLVELIKTWETILLSFARIVLSLFR